MPLPELPCEKSDAYFVLRDGLPVCSWLPTLSRNRVKHVRHGGRALSLPRPSAGKTALSGHAPQQDPEGNKTMVRFSRKTNSNMSLRKKTERRLAGQHFI